MIHILKTICLVLLVTATVWMILRTKAAIDFREKYLEGTEANKIVEFHGTRMSQGDFVLHYIVEQRVNRLATLLVQQDSSTLWTLLYALYGMIGNYSYYLMRFVRSEKARSPGPKAAARFIARLTLAALCGGICFLLVSPLASPLGSFLGSWIPNKNAGSGSLTVHAVSDSFLFLPILAGAFIGNFYAKLEGILSTVMGRLERWFSGKK